MLTVKKIIKSYRRFRRITPALEPFSYIFDHGLYGILGPNGAGKSTLLSILARNLRPDGGQVLLDGEDVRSRKTGYPARLGYLPQNGGGYPDVSAEDFLRYVAVSKGASRTEAEAQSHAILRDIDLYDCRHDRVASFSGGTVSRLLLAQAFMGNPEVVILDEPTASMDPAWRACARKLMAREAQNRTVLLATHIVSDVESAAREVLLLRRGRLVDSGTPFELTEKVRGRVWGITVYPEEVPTFTARFRIAAMTNTKEGVTLRILSNRRPAPEAVAVDPNLEDYYLCFTGELL